VLLLLDDDVLEELEEELELGELLVVRANVDEELKLVVDKELSLVVLRLVLLVLLLLELVLIVDSLTVLKLANVELELKDVLVSLSAVELVDTSLRLLVLSSTVELELLLVLIDVLVSLSAVELNFDY